MLILFADMDEIELAEEELIEAEIESIELKKPKLEGERKTPTQLLNKTFKIDIEKSYFFKYLMINIHYPIMEGDVETDGELTKFLIVRSVACQAYVEDRPVYFFTNNEGLKEMMKRWKDEDRKSVMVKLAKEGRKYVFTEIPKN
jgi:hypothetical protein